MEKTVPFRIPRNLDDMPCHMNDPSLDEAAGYLLWLDREVTVCRAYIESLNNPVSEAVPVDTSGSVRYRMEEFFRANGNQPATVHQIADAIGSNWGAVQTIIYRRNHGQFEKVHKGGGFLTRWRKAEVVA